MNTNPPNDYIDCGSNKMPTIINIQKGLKTGLVKTNKGKIFPVKLQDWLIEGIMLHDYVELKKSPVTGEWIVTDYFINPEVYGAIHNSYQTSYDDMMLNEDGVPYE